MSGPLFISSGDLIADRRYDLARGYAADGDLAAAADLYAQAVELAPGFASAWFALGEAREALGDRDGARAAFARARDADPQDRHGAALHLARLGGADPATGALQAYVRTLFDQYAPRFDRALEDLNYSAPARLREAITQHGTRFGSMLDLGCGTGLAGAAFRPHVDWLAGVDLSPKMIEVARAKGLYDRLAVADIGAASRRTGRRGVSSGRSPRMCSPMWPTSRTCARRSGACSRRAGFLHLRSRRMTARARSSAPRCATRTASRSSATRSRMPA